MGIVWLRDPNLNASITYQTLGPLSSIDGFYIWYCVHFCYRLDLLVIVSLFLSAFSFLFSLLFFYDMYTCVHLSLLPSLFVKQIYSCSFSIHVYFPLRSLSSTSLPSFGNGQKIISFGGSSVDRRPLFSFRLAILFSILSALCFPKLRQIWWIIFRYTCIGPPLSHKYL